MKLICIANVMEVYDDDKDYWIIKNIMTREITHKSKEDNPFYPLSLVCKYDAEPVDNEFLEVLAAKL